MKIAIGDEFLFDFPWLLLSWLLCGVWWVCEWEAGWLKSQRGVEWREWRRLSHWHATIVGRVDTTLAWLGAVTPF